MTQEQLNEQLFEAVNIEDVKKAIQDGANVNAKHKEDWTPLHSASFCGRTEIVKVLIENGADVNAKNERGRTPLYIAEFWDRKEIIELLKQHGGV